MRLCSCRLMYWLAPCWDHDLVDHHRAQCTLGPEMLCAWSFCNCNRAQCAPGPGTMRAWLYCVFPKLDLFVVYSQYAQFFCHILSSFFFCILSFFFFSPYTRFFFFLENWCLGLMIICKLALCIVRLAFFWVNSYWAFKNLLGLSRYRKLCGPRTCLILFNTSSNRKSTILK